LTDAGYVAGGYGVTVVAIGAYIGHMWARNRAMARLIGPSHRSGHTSGAPGHAERDQNAGVASDDGRSGTSSPDDRP